MSAAEGAQNITSRAFITAIVANAGLLAVQVGAFVFLRKKLERIYSPRSYLPPLEKRAQELPAGFWRWIPAIINTPSEDIIHKNGLDAYMFLRFLKILLRIFLVFTIATFVVILPIDSVRVANSPPGVNQFTWANIDAPIYQKRYAAHIILVYLFTFFVIILIHNEMLNFVHLRQQFLASKSHSRLAQARTVLITCVPDELANDMDMRRFASFVPGGVDKVWFFRDTKALNKLFAERHKVCVKLEFAESTILHRATKSWRKKRMQTDAKKNAKDEERQGNIEGLSLPPRPSKELLDQLVPRNKRPKHRTGFLGIFGKKVDTVEFCKAEISRLNPLIDQARQNLSDSPFLGSVFVRCNLQMGAHVLAQCVSYQKPSIMSYKWVEAHPKDIVWSNLDDGAATTRSRFVISWLVTVGLVIAWAFPVAFVGTLSNVTSLCGKVSRIHLLCKAPIVARGIVQGVLPPLILAILFALVPFILRGLASSECIPRHSLISISVYRRFFLFLMIHGFLVVTLTSGITTAIAEIITTPASTIPKLASRLPGASTFFLTYMVSEGLAGAGSALAQTASVFMYFVRKRILGRTPRQAFEVTYTMPSVDFGHILPMISLLAAIGFTYSVISPLINAAALISYACLYLAWKFLLLQVFDQPYEQETGGLYFPIALSYLFVGLYVEQICIACLFLLRISIARVSSIVEAVAMLALIVITAYSHIVIKSTFQPLTEFLPMSMAIVDIEKKIERVRRRRLGIIDEIEREIDEFSRDGLDTVERGLSQLPHKIHEELHEVAEKLESAESKDKQLICSALHEGLPDLFEHMSPPKKATRVKSNVKSTSTGVAAPQSFRRRSTNATSSSQKRKDPLSDDLADDSSADEADYDEHAFDHPSNYQKQKWIWIPKDTLGLSNVLVEELEESGVAASDLYATMDDHGIVNVHRSPPDERWDGGVNE